MEKKPNVWSVCATAGRHQLLERSVACFLAQDYDGPHTLLIYNNSEVSQDLFKDAPNSGLKEQRWKNVDGKGVGKDILLVNNSIDGETHQSYSNLGSIYRDALEYIPDNVNIITHHDDDDIFLPNHISEGVKGFQRARLATRYVNDIPSTLYKAYKPEQSWFRHAGGIEKMGNNLEPSIFVSANYIKNYGYKLTTTDQHFGWFGPLLENNELYIDPKGASTLIYNWGDMNIPTFKTSGNSHNPDNFQNYRIFSQDHGDQVINPISSTELQRYYNEVPK